MKKIEVDASIKRAGINTVVKQTLSQNCNYDNLKLRKTDAYSSIYCCL
jgi:hypothetical protein